MQKISKTRHLSCAVFTFCHFAFSLSENKLIHLASFQIPNLLSLLANATNDTFCSDRPTNCKRLSLLELSYTRDCPLYYLNTLHRHNYQVLENKSKLPHLNKMYCKVRYWLNWLIIDFKQRHFSTGKVVYLKILYYWNIYLHFHKIVRTLLK